MRWLLAVLACVALATFYVVAASTHATRVNTIKSRADQTGYLIDAEDVYANLHGQAPPRLIGARNRMPLYPVLLALVYDPWRSDDTFFERARQFNIYVSVALLVLVWFTASRTLPRHAATNLTGVAAFGWYVFKAGYAQSELLFYTLFFATFVATLGLFSRTARRPVPLQAVLVGTLAGLSHLTKAAMLPYLAVAGTVGLGWALTDGEAGLHEPEGAPNARLLRLASLALIATVFLGTVWPYISTSKRVFGQYFYNVNSTFYVWYDTWPQASVGTALHGDGQHWPDLPASALPSASRYLREHTLPQIATRIGSGFADMRTVLRRDFDLVPYLALYLGMATWLGSARTREMADMIREHRWQVLFIAAYLTTYLFATAFYHPISGTGTGRFLLAHALPLFYVLAVLTSSRRFDSLRLGRIDALPAFQWLVTATILFNVLFRVWPRLMSTYGGF